MSVKNKKRFIKNVFILSCLVELSNRSTAKIKPTEIGLEEGLSYSKDLIQTLTFNKINSELKGVSNDQ